jgi:hypothetical protein
MGYRHGDADAPAHALERRGFDLDAHAVDGNDRAIVDRRELGISPFCARRVPAEDQRLRISENIDYFGFVLPNNNF